MRAEATKSLARKACNSATHPHWGTSFLLAGNLQCTLEALLRKSPPKRHAADVSPNATQHDVKMVAAPQAGIKYSDFTQFATISKP